MAICFLPQRGDVLSQLLDQLLCVCELLLLGTWSFAYYWRVDVLSQLLLDSSPYMSGSRIINHPLRDEPGLKTKKVNHHSSEYSSPATHVRQGSWGNVCVTRCMCEYSREHIAVVCTYSSRHHPVLGRGTPLVLISVLLSSDLKISS